MSENNVTRPIPPNVPLPGTPSAPLFFNLLPLRCRQEEAEMHFTCHPAEGLYPFTPAEVPAALAAVSPGGSAPPQLYTSAAPGGTGVAVQVKLAEHPALARLWCMQHIRRLLVPVADYCRHDGPFATQFWCSPARMAAAVAEAEGCTDAAADSAAAAEGRPAGVAACRPFYRFTLRVLPGNGPSSPALLVTCNGMGYLLDATLHDIPGHPSFRRCIHRAAFRGKILRLQELPDTAMYHYDEVRPVLCSRTSRQLLPEGLPARDGRTEGESFPLITAFLQRHLFTKAFAAVAGCGGRFREVAAGAAGRVASAGSPLLFGEEGQAHCPAAGMTTHGPLKLPAGTHFSCFILCREEDRPLAERLTSLLTGENGWRLGKFMRVPLFCSPAHHIFLGSGSDAVQQLTHRLSQMAFDTDTVWCAFYIRPGHGQEADRLCDILTGWLLHRGVLVQPIAARLLTEAGTPPALLPGLDLVVRLGGTPWRVAGSPLPDPVAGFAVYRAVGPASGAAVLLAPGGQFAGADTFNPAHQREWGGLAAALLHRWERKGNRAQRLVLHLPRALQPLEMSALQAMLEEQRPGLQVVVMVIRRCPGSHPRVLSSTNGGTAPADGTWVRCSRHRYLLYTCCRRRGQQEAAGPAVPLLIRFTLLNPGDDTIGHLAPALLGQVHSLIRMHRPAGVPAWLPLTLTLPLLLARKAQVLPGRVLPEEGKEVPWFG